MKSKSALAKMPCLFHQMLIASASFLGMMVQESDAMAAGETQIIQSQREQDQSAQTQKNNSSSEKMRPEESQKEETTTERNEIRNRSRMRRPYATKYGGPRRPRPLKDDLVQEQNNQDKAEKKFEHQGDSGLSENRDKK